MMVRCPTCKTMTAYEGNPFRPFCSERCKNADLHQWLMPPKEDEEDGKQAQRTPDSDFLE